MIFHNMFPSISRSLGVIKQGTTHIIEYPYTNIEKIIKITPPCTCTDTVNDVPTQRISVKYKVPEIPVHLIAKGLRSMKTDKWISVIFTSKTEPDREQTIVLGFNATIVL